MSLDEDTVRTIFDNICERELERCSTKRERRELTESMNNLKATALQFGASEYERGREAQR